eukprot:5262664-Ditylum_brightwellii.AAC.1
MIAYFTIYCNYGIYPLYLTTKASDIDNPHYNQTMNGPDDDGFKDEMDSKMGILIDIHSWIVLK